MTININDLRGKAAAVRDRMEKRITDSQAAGAVFSAAEADAHRADAAELKAINDQIAMVSDYLLEKAAVENADAGDNSALIDRNIKTPGKIDDAAKAFKAYLQGGIAAVSDEEMARMQARRLKNGLTSANGADGGYLVPELLYGSIIQAMKQFGGILSEVEYMPSDNGAEMSFVTSDPTSEMGDILVEGTQTDEGNTSFGSVKIPTFTYTSKRIVVSRALINDSYFDLLGYIRSLLAMRLGRRLATDMTVGSGNGRIKGVLTSATAGKVASTGHTTSVTYLDLLALKHSVDPAYRATGNCCYGLNDNSLMAICSVVDNNGRPIFVPGYETGSPQGQPDRILGHDVCIMQEMPDMAANAKSILFGDFTTQKWRAVNDFELFKYVESAFTSKGMVAFEAFNRHGGGSTDVGGAVKYYQNSAS